MKCYQVLNDIEKSTLPSASKGAAFDLKYIYKSNTLISFYRKVSTISHCESIDP